MEPRRTNSSWVNKLVFVVRVRSGASCRVLLTRGPVHAVAWGAGVPAAVVARFAVHERSTGGESQQKTVVLARQRHLFSDGNHFLPPDPTIHSEHPQRVELQDAGGQWRFVRVSAGVLSLETRRNSPALPRVLRRDMHFQGQSMVGGGGGGAECWVEGDTDRIDRWIREY